MNNNENLASDIPPKNSAEANNNQSLNAPGKAVYALLVLLSGMLGLAAVVSAYRIMVFPCLLLASAAVGILAVLFCCSRSPITFAAPLISAGGSLIAGAGFFTAVQGALAITLTASLVAFLAAKKSDPFRSRVTAALAVSLIAALAFSELLQYYFGSVGAGLDAISEFVGLYTEDMLNSIYESSASISISTVTEKLSRTAVMLLPGVIGIFGIASTWIIYGVIKALSVPFRCNKIFFPSAALAPRPIAVLYIVTFFFSVFSGILPEAADLTVMNLYLLLSLLFFGEGARFIFTIARLSSAGRSKAFVFIVSIVIIAVASVMVPIFGAFVTLRTKKIIQNKEN